MIYQAIDEIQSALKGMLKPIYEEKELGRAEIRAIFRSSKVGNIAGCLVTSGIIRRNAKARLLRDNVVVAETVTISSLKREKDDATEVRDGYECGLTLTLQRHQGRRRHRGVRARRERADVDEPLARRTERLTMVDPARARRLAKRIATIVASAIEFEIKDPRLAGVTITDAKVTGDLHDATVFYSVFGTVPGRRAGLRGCGGGAGQRQGRAALQGRRRHSASGSPRRLAFERDKVPDAAHHMEDLLARARAADEDLARIRQGAKHAGDADPYRVTGWRIRRNHGGPRRRA